MSRVHKQAGDGGSADGEVRIHLQLQRRRKDDSLDDAPVRRAIRNIAELRVPAGDWREFSFDFDQLGVSTHSVRLLIEVQDVSGEKQGVTVGLDDLAWVEWSTPWLDNRDGIPAGNFATHVHFK